MFEIRKIACHLLCAGTDFCHNGAQTKFCEKLDQMSAAHRPAQQGFTGLVLYVQVKYGFA
ncbi:MAG: hypothetical protein NVSMB6_15210 [Burkholderiaceae bacterium]